MKIKTFEEFISEGLWNKGLNRNKINNLRKDQGHKVKTCLGSELIVKNDFFDYDGLIKAMLNGASACEYFHILSLNVFEGEIDEKYIYNLPNNVIIEFETYERLKLYDVEFLEECDENEYINVCKLIVDVFKSKEVYYNTYHKEDDVNESYFILYKFDREYIDNKFNGTLDNALDVYRDYWSKVRNISGCKNLTYNMYIDKNDMQYVGVAVEWNSYKNYKKLVDFTQKYFNEL